MLTIDICSSYVVKKWFVVFLKFLVQRVFVLVVSLANNMKTCFLKGTTFRATSPLELVHSDLMSFPTHSFLGAKYALTIIDDFTRRSWVYFRKYKSEVFATFKTFKAFVEKQPSYSIKKLHTDNWG